MATGREPGQVRKEAAAATISGVRTPVLRIRHHNSANGRLSVCQGVPLCLDPILIAPKSYTRELNQ